MTNTNLRRPNYWPGLILVVTGLTSIADGAWAQKATTPTSLATHATIAAAPGGDTTVLPQAVVASKYFGGDAPWFRANIPFFDCSDPELTQVYYYRCKLFKAHLKDLGKQG